MAIAPLPYHVAVRDHLKTHEPGLWQWFMSDDFSGAYAEACKLDLLKSCYRMGRDGHGELYTVAETAAMRLAIDCPITLYQAQSASAALNAALYFLPDELSVVLSGPITDLLTPLELRSLFGHEFSHHRLYTLDGGEFFAAARFLYWCAEQPRCHDAYVQTARRYQLHTELYADRGAALVCDGPDAAIAALVKVETGLKSVTVADYLAQADEVLGQDPSGSKRDTHPESYIRAKALSLTTADVPADGAAYLQLVRGALDARRLDVLDQRELAQLTFDIAQSLGQDSRFRSDAHGALLKEYFPSFEWEAMAQGDDELSRAIAEMSASTLTYLSYVLLDLATADSDDAMPLLGPTLRCAQRLGLLKAFEALARKELRLKKADTDRLLRDSADVT